jgi:hypothetical protein
MEISRFRTSWPLLAVTGAALFTLAWAVLGAVSPGYRLFDLVIDPYSPIAQPISGLGLGVTGPYMNAAFILGGLLVAAGAIASIGRLSTSRLATAALVLIAVMGLGMIVDGVFTLESVMLHLLGFLLAVPVPAVGFVLLAIALPRLRVPLLVGAVATLALFALFMATFDPYSAGDNTGISGLIQRVLVTVALATMAIVTVSAARTSGGSRTGRRP